MARARRPGGQRVLPAPPTGGPRLIECCLIEFDRASVEGRWVADWADPDPDPAPVTTIAWRCWHVAVDCLDSYSARLFGRTGTGLEGTAWVPDWASARTLLDDAWSVFRSGVASWSEDDLLVPLGPAWGPFANHSNVDLALHAKREVIHHGAEIALMRDLYRYI